MSAEIVNLYLSVKDVGSKENNYSNEDNSKYIEMPDVDIREEERVKLLHQLIRGLFYGIVVSPIHINEVDKILNILEGLGFAHSVNIVEINPNEPGSDWGDKRIVTKDIRVVFDGEEDLNDKLNEIIRVAFLVVQSVEFDWVSWIPF